MTTAPDLVPNLAPNPVPNPAPDPVHPVGSAPGPHGGDVERVARALGVDPASLLDLSASLNPVAPDMAALARPHLDALRHYPDAERGRRLLAEAIGVAPDRLLLTNGGAEAIALLAPEVGGQVHEPEFSLYPRASVPGTAGPSPRWRSNPHNPTGRLAGPEEHAGVWDEAFFPLATGRWTRGDAALATVGSLTKLFACPGLRLGYAIAEPDLVLRLAARQPEWSVNALALAVLPDLLAQVDLSRWAKQVAVLRADLIGLLHLHGLAPQLSDANFVLCPAPPWLRPKLLTYGVVVRDCASFGLDDHVRIAVPDEQGLERVAGALDRTISDAAIESERL